ncbi:MAG: hypothetical protein KAS32_28885 [Candidatus Peribacteraceae bacterium]|nr:hypothetical protein [Candidatus Peribacteraceae bacterium]
MGGGLSFGSGMFPQIPLLQEEGLLNERWNQPGATIINNLTQNVDADTVLMTTGAGKAIYIKQIIFSLAGVMGAGDAAIMCDNTAPDSTNKRAHLGLAGNEDDCIIFNFNVPLRFVNGVTCVDGAAIDCEITLIGWQEDL